MILGVDVGGVIIDKDRNDNSDTSLFGPNYLHAKDVESAFGCLGILNRDAFKDRVWIVSKCGENIERKTREWMEHSKFHDVTGIPKERLVFVRERAEKAPAAARLGLTHFVDDKLEVLHHMKDVVACRILFRPAFREARDWWGSIGGVHVFDAWDELADWLISSWRPAQGGA